MLPEFTVSTWFMAVAILASVALFGPGLRYRIDHAELQDMDAGEFLNTLEAVTDAQLTRRTRLDVFTNGEQFYDAEIAAIRGAQQTVNLEAYIFLPDASISDELKRAVRRGVEVSVAVCDAVCDEAFAARLEADVADDLRNSREVTFSAWQKRGILKRAPEAVGWLLERQQ